MDPYFAKIYATAGITSTAATSALAMSRFRNASAGGSALAGGFVPWLIIAMLGVLMHLPRERSRKIPERIVI